MMRHQIANGARLCPKDQPQHLDNLHIFRSDGGAAAGLRHSRAPKTVFRAGLVLTVLFALALAGCRTPSSTPPVAETWRGLHVPVYSDEQLSKLQDQLPKLAADGANVLVLQVDYHFDFKSHPELRDGPFITKAAARGFVKAARKLGIGVIPELDC